LEITKNLVGEPDWIAYLSNKESAHDFWTSLARRWHPGSPASVCRTDNACDLLPNCRCWMKTLGLDFSNR
jgi:hypothetical protein